MATLQVSILVVLVLLAVAIQTSNAVSYNANVGGTLCCKNYGLNQPPSQGSLKDFVITSDSCNKRAIVFITTKHGFICGDPRQVWVEKLHKKLASKGHEGHGSCVAREG